MRIPPTAVSSTAAPDASGSAASSASAAASSAAGSIQTRGRRGDRFAPDRVVAHAAAGDHLVGDDHARAVGRAHPGRGQRHVLDRSAQVADRDQVADADRLRDGERDPGDRVAERVARREADDGADQRAGGERRAREPVERVELQQREEQPGRR